MPWVNRAIHLLGRWLHRNRVEEELHEEVATWFEIMVERGTARGLTREEAERAARVAFEGPLQVEQKVREARVGAALETMWQDVRFAGRVLAKSPAFTFFAVVTIALGLGANAAIFSLVNGVLLKSSGYPEPERIVELWEKPPKYPRNVIAPANYLDWAKQNQSFASMAAKTGGSMTYSGAGEPRSLRVGFVSASYFEVFGAKAALGRTFAKDEDQPGKEKVAVLTHRLWWNQFGGDRAVAGREILLDGQAYTVIGVLPAAGEFDRRWEDLWIPLAFPPKVARDYHYLTAVARLKRGVSVPQAQAEMSAIAAHIAELYPAIKKGWGATVDRYLDRQVGPQLHLSLVVLMWAVVAVLLIGCANLANLMMARATLRGREIALRMALGARRGRVIRMLLTESLLLSLGGAVVGIALGYGLLQWIQSLLPPFYFPAEANVAMDSRVLLFLAAATILTSVAFGLAPAIQSSRRDSAESLKEGGRASSASRGKLYVRHVFVAAQVAAAFILLVGGGLLIHSFQRLMNVDTGFDSEGVVAADLPLAMGRDPDAMKLTLYVNQLLEAVRAVPGMQAAAVTTGLPLSGWGDGMPFKLPDRRDERFGSGFKIVTPGYFQALRIHLLAGRFLDEGDTAGSPPVVVVNQSFVKSYFPNASAIGKRILVERILPSRHGLGPQASWEIVGVVADEKGNGLDSPSDEGAYGSFAQSPVVGLGMVARGSGDAGAIVKSVERAVWSVNRNQALEHPMTVEQIKTESLMSRRLPTMLLGGFAILAMLLACAGIYGVLSLVTASRTQELGIRVALGASRGDLVRLVVGGGAIPVLAGIVVGLAGAVGLARFIGSMLFATSPIDGPNLLEVTALFLAIAFAACLAPAWRAAKVDPITALREE
ncbi:MAG TPA: ABC transporter permease [Candidatus Acidoferrales bacterium]|jgi:predicted permease|nr:ABC transporter permease [Candidatus Acidoferrales bacterium]